MQDVPVAIVNEDTGAEINGEIRNVGNEVCDKLREDGSLKFDFTTAEKAKKGVDGNKYYASLTMPEDFSKEVASVSSTDKKVSVIEYSVNEKRNYLASQILNTAVNKIEKEVVSSIDREITLTLANKIREVPKSLGTLSTGLNTMYSGSQQLVTGAKKLDSGASSLDSGAKKLDQGAQSLKTGTTSLKSGTASLKSGADSLDNGLGDIKKGVSKINSQVPALKSGVNALDAGMNSDTGLKAGVADYTSGVSLAAAGLNTYYSSLASFSEKNLPDAEVTLNADQVKTLKGLIYGDGTAENPGLAEVNKGMQNLVDENGDLNAGAAEVAARTSSLNSKVPALTSGLKQLQSGVDSAKTGSGQLADGASSVDSGAGQLQAGSSNLKSGTSSLVSGTGTLKSGTGSLASGMNSLDSGIKSGKDGVDSSLKSVNGQLPALNGVEDYAASPVKVKKNEVDYVPNYGTAFAPYFLSLSLWVGGLIIFFGIYLDVDKRYKYLCRDSANPVIRSIAYILLGVAQALILAVVVKFALGLHVEHMYSYILSCVLVSAVFISIIQFCLVHLKDFGKFIALLLLILQLTSCGGTFPMETVPKLFNVLYPYMPMTYSVGLFKETISGATGSSMMMNISVLVTLLIVFTAATILMSVMKKGARHLRKMKRASRMAKSLQA